MVENLKEQQQLYDRTWRKGLEAGKEERGNLQANLQFLAKANLLQPDNRILEIGCGIGTIVSELTGQGYDITGIDISREAIAYGLKKYGNIKLMAQAAEKLQFADETFDIVLSFDLFEHIVQVDKHVSEVRRVLRTGGYYLCETPNKYCNAIFETLVGKSLRWRRAHPSLHTPGQLKRRLIKHGFELKFIRINTVNEFTINKLKRLRPLHLVVKHINFEKLPLMLQTNLYVVARKLQ
jgi:2-polyprenyl-3-methyl-5-hydroxy-6-metoxy-1,4-benzoquinol methylase